jgi:hydroxyethylthiazole kinase-like uncharacterized protein yjeF
MKIFTAKQLYKADEITLYRQQISSIDLMERAAEQVFIWLDNLLQGASVPIHIFCGIGNNGGDGLAVGRMLLHKKYNVKCYVVNYSDQRSPCFLTNYNRIKNMASLWPSLLKKEADFPEIQKEDILIDAIFGIGLNRPLEGWVKNLIQYLNISNAFILSIDIPSGLFVDVPTPDKDAVIKANITLTFQAPKLVFFLPETGVFSKSMEILPIGLDAAYLTKTPTEALLIQKQEILTMYVPREKFGHKGTYGHSLLIGGSYGKMGAVTLAALSCLRVGAGKVTAGIPTCGYTILQTAVPEVMVLTDTDENEITNFSFPIHPEVIGIGIGLGTSAGTEKGFLKFLKTQKNPMVIDADALNILAKNPKALKDVPKMSVLTPHPGELERLIGTWTDDFDKLKKTKALSKKHNWIIAIKGAHTITVYQDKLYVNTTGNPGMATAGSGDVLTGIITGLISQGYETLDAAIFGVYLHGSAGDIAVEKTGFASLIASDIVSHIGDAYLELFQREEPVNKGNLKIFVK